MTPERLSEIKNLLDADYVLDLTYVVSECVEEIERLNIDNASMRQTIEHYANPKNWQLCDMDSDQTKWRDWISVEDGYATARAALAKVSKAAD